jgi:hypothetical protein
MLSFLYHFISDCGELSILNGGVSSSNTTYGTEIYVDCFEGYDVSNPFAVTCQSNGNWSNVPTCDPVGKILYLIYMYLLIFTVVNRIVIVYDL